MGNLSSILVVEDDLAIARMYALKLANTGYVVELAHDGVEGYIKAERLRPALILLDIFMPMVSGDKLLEKVRATEWGSTIKVIILTNTSKDEAPMQLRLLNVDRYIVKAHYTPTQVLEIVKEVLKS